MAFAGAPPARAAWAPRRLVWGALAVGVVLALGLLPSVRAAFQANLGAVAQSRAELAAYHWPEVPIQDALRREGRVDLGPALRRYAAALALDPGNVTANRRLGQIELAQGQYAAAREHLAAAYAADPGQRVTRLLLGESQAVEGAVVPAAALWATVAPAPGHFAGRVWWYGFLGETQAQHGVEEAAARAARVRGE
jgi:predicted Zn-dependent protease